MKVRCPQILPVIGAMVTALAVASGCSGGGAEGGCGATPSCGGDLTGQWQVDGVCQYLPPQPDQPLNYKDYVANTQSNMITPPQPQPTTSGNWCSWLDFQPPDANVHDWTVKNVVLWHEPAGFTSGQVSFTPDHKYDAELLFTTQSTTIFTPSCLQANGFAPTCSKLQKMLDAYYASAAMANGQPTYRAPKGADPGAGIQCAEMTDGGCACDYTYALQVSDNGSWVTNGAFLSQTTEAYAYNGMRNQTNEPTGPTVSTFCASGDHLTLTGSTGNSLSGVVGLRTMSLRKM
jgi:hypothetical protein